MILTLCAHTGLLLTFDLASNIGRTLLLIGLGFAAIPMAERSIGKLPIRTAFWVVVAGSLAIRVLLLPLPPTLSGDVNRYLWDGRVLATGSNPYLLAPDAPELEPLRDDLWSELDHRDVPTVYPPVAQALFVAASRLPWPRPGLKVTLVLLDLIACVLLWFLAQHWQLPVERTLWYAWNPLVTIEVAGMGHVDALGVCLVVITTLLLARSPTGFIGPAVSAAGAVLSKLVPVVAVPVWARQSRRPRSLTVAVSGLSAVGLLSVFVTTGGVPSGLVRYGVSWEFNGPLFEPLWRVLDAIRIHALAEAALDRLKTLTGWHDFWNLLYPFNYPQLWAKAALALGLAAALIRVWRAPTTLQSLRGVFGSVLLFSATVYPWYALWVLPWAALSRDLPWLALSGLLCLSYLPQNLDLALFPWVYGLIWLPFAVLLVRYR